MSAVKMARQAAYELNEDLAEIQRTVPDATERDALTKARIGQGRFRADVAKLWRIGEACTLTGLGIPELLVASHIRPWRQSSNQERLDPCNGLLLVAHADKLFDRDLMSFREERGDFYLVLHPRVQAGIKKLGLSEGMVLRTNHLGLSQARRFSVYMSEHLSRFETRVAGDTPTGRK